MNAFHPNTLWLLTAVLGAAMLIGLIWYVRQVSLGRAALPGAFLISLVVHSAIAGSLFYITMGTQIAKVVQQAQTYLPVLSDYAASTRFEASEGYQATPQPFELVRELGVKDSVATADVSQQRLETPEMRVAAEAYKTEIPVPREEAAGPRADALPLLPDTPRPTSPARTLVPDVETPEVPTAPLEDVPSVAPVARPEAPAPKADVDVARVAAGVDPLASAKPSRTVLPAGPGKIVSEDVRDDRTVAAPKPSSTGKSAPALARTIRSLEGDNVLVEPEGPASAAGAQSNPAPRGGPGKVAVKVEVSRQGVPALPFSDVGVPASAGGVGIPTAGGKPGSAVAPALPGGRASERSDPLPKFAGGGNLPTRRGPGDSGPPYAEANIGPEALLRLRQGDSSLESLELRGGSKGSQAAVKRGLTWFEQHQFPDGHWSLHDFAKRCKDHPPCTAPGSAVCDTAATAFSLLPFLGEGHTQNGGKYPDVVQRGLDWLVTKQRKSGELTTGDEGKARMYGHAVAAIAVCEAYAMSEDPRLREPAQRAIDFIVSAQHKQTGGWRYQPNEAADTSVVGWQVMALKSGQMARLNVPQQPFDLARKWLDSVEGQGSQRGHFGYQTRVPTPAMTAEGLLCREYLGASRDDENLNLGANYLLANLPDKKQENSYYWYYGTQTMYHLQGDHWKKWNASLRDMLVETQVKEGAMAGTWAPVDKSEVIGGRLYSTSLRVLMLEVYYRHLPLYQALEE